MSTSSPVLHIAIAFDEVYVNPVFVLLTSIFLNNRDYQVQVHAIATDVPESAKARMIEYARQQGAICIST
ncbi:hypothetical protein MUN84_16420 [Hymenobacter sp. 5516J-16]|uniref:hypothetical protein n=1 Tax=Hymenobacter sp. 5516J-16 TaxID=2932253 RepID=UPI001FD4561D|nr:hypothetical protein [Hymenobacter sp. 5516J-16]UOQ76165.1 hypothetical protein MUN84_16420 [Hymenobacter sp. 5516J-16]